MMQVDDHVIIRLISKVVKGSSKVFQKLLKYFNGTAILASFVLPAAGFFFCYFYIKFKQCTITRKIIIILLLSKNGSIL